MLFWQKMQNSTTDNKVNSSPLSEYLAIEFYTPTGLNTLDASKSYLGSYPKMFSEYGVRVYHVDSRLGEFVYQKGDWYYNDYVYNYSIDDLYSNTGYSNYFAIFNNLISNRHSTKFRYFLR